MNVFGRAARLQRRRRDGITLRRHPAGRRRAGHHPAAGRQAPGAGASGADRRSGAGTTTVPVGHATGDPGGAGRAIPTHGSRPQGTASGTSAANPSTKTANEARVNAIRQILAHRKGSRGDPDPGRADRGSRAGSAHMRSHHLAQGNEQTFEGQPDRILSARRDRPDVAGEGEAADRTS